MLKVNHLIKQYDKFTLNCSLEVKSGRITGLIGRNGAGKTTAFKAVLGLIRIDSGSVELFGKNSKTLTAGEKQKLGVTLSDSGFSNYLTIKQIDHILKTMYDCHDSKKFISLCQRFHLPQKKRLKEFSTGMRAKVKLLAAISHNARFLVLDEPTLGLDVVARDELLGLLRDYMEEDESRSILISSHISSDLEGLCDDVYLINEGEIVLHERTDKLLSDYALIKADQEQFQKIEKQYLITYKKEPWGYSCLTKEKQFYMENYPELVVENGNLDGLMVMMTGGDEV